MASRFQALPRTVVVCVLVAIGMAARASLDGLLHPGRWIPAWHWALFAASLTWLLVVAVCRPGLFQVRNFRLAGLATAALALLVFAPLPGVVHGYEELVPRSIVLTIGAGIAVYATVFLLGPANGYAPRRPLRGSSGELMVAVAIAFGGAALLPIWLSQLDNLPILQLITGQSTGVDIALDRQAALQGLESTPLRLLVGVLRNTYLMFAAGWFVASWVLADPYDHVTRRRFAALSALTFAVAAIYALATTERAIIGQLLIVALISWTMASGRVLRLRGVLGLGLAGLLFPLIFGVFNAASFSASVESTWRRVFFVPADVMTQYFVLFPERQDHLTGASIPKLPRLVGLETFDLSGYVYETAYQFDDRFVGSANASFIGVGWANFGVAGVLIWCAVTALALLWLESLLSAFPRRSAAALRGVASVQAVLLTSADVGRTVLNYAPGFLDLAIVIWLVSVIHRRRSTAPVDPLSGSRRAIGPRPPEGVSPRPTPTPPDP